MAKNAYEMFGTEKALETEGVWFNFGPFRIKVSRAGGNNRRFRNLLQAKMKPYRHQIDNETMDEKVTEQIFRDCYAQTVVIGWQTNTSDGPDEVWSDYLETPEGNLEFTAENCSRVFKELPDFFKQVQKLAMDMSYYRNETEDQDAKN
jgi:hypothetical protein